MLEYRVDRSGATARVATDLPSQVTAGSLASWRITVVPSAPLPAGARIALARRWPSDWGTPQTRDPAAPDYLSATASTGTALRVWTARLHPWHPFDHVLFVELLGALPAGAELRLAFGERSGGSPGANAQTFVEEASPLAVRLCPDAASGWTEVARLETRVAGAAPARWVLTAPSRVVAGEPFEIHARAEDEWGNPATVGPATLSIEGGAGGPARLAIGGDAGPTARCRVALPAGVHRLRAIDAASGTVAESNPIVSAGAQPTRLFWGDIHAQSVIGCGARSIEAFYRHARDFAACDFASHQANCFLVSAPEWDETQAVTARLNEPGRFVTLLGVEWSAASHLGGDRNLYFPGDRAELRRCSHEFVADRGDLATDLPHADDLHRHYRDTDTLVALHVGGRTTDLRWHEPRIERLIEVHSTHATSEWFLFDALARGYRLGVVAGSDGVDGRPGASHPGHMGVRNVRGGLVAVAMRELTREALLAALRARRCYATTGERIVLDFEVDGQPMGAEVTATGQPRLRVRVEGTAPLAAVEIFRGTERVWTAPLVPTDSRPSRWLRVSWSGASAPGNWQRARMVWDGALRIEGGRFGDARGWAFDTPDEGIVAREAQRIAWRSVTAGDWDGLEAEVQGEPGALLRFASEPLSVAVPLAAIDDAPFEVHAENPQRRLRVERLPAGLSPPAFEATIQDEMPLAGTHAYWVRVRQHDGAMAWSSPVFVTFEESAR
jgi:hypothetical protein